MPDFEVYWRAGVRALAAEPLYREEDAHFRLKYLPAFAVLCIPAGLLPLTASKARVVHRVGRPDPHPDRPQPDAPPARGAGRPGSSPG